MLIFNNIYINRIFSIDSVVAAYYHENANIHMPTPIHENFKFWQIVYIIKGNAKLIVDGTVFNVSDGQVIFRVPNKTSFISYPDENISIAVIDFTSSSPHMDYFTNKIFNIYGEECSNLLDSIFTFARLSTPIKDSESKAGFNPKIDADPIVVQFVATNLERFLIMTFSRLQQLPYIFNNDIKTNNYNEFKRIVTSVKQYLSDNTDKNFSVKEISDFFCINPNTLMKIFKNDTGESIINYFISLKIKKAKKLIQTSSMNFTQISESLGFSSCNYFSRVFKNQTGITPSEYSKIQRKK